MAQALLVVHQKELLPAGLIVEIRIWRLPEPDAERPHGWKYSLFFGRPGERIVAYDNERGKGDHRHQGDKESAYRFIDLQTLIADFRRDVARWEQSQ